MIIIGSILLGYAFSALVIYWVYCIDSVYGLGKRLFDESGELSSVFKNNYNRYLMFLIFTPILNSILVLLFIGGGLFGLVKYLVTGKYQ